ncbi:ankyrin repeat-containing domain protein [Paraphoma chrysanthemicola]|uniref:Ankyrin repeat-containing domain protein n=1 Tax=Paraphoma chrysanthemicola TaxID=798071 RepID=A0A8K0W4H5_9PLEO|nr:ankyrin repeat-containing domain protein [Paraphoma chrysanthemicola]
MRLIKGLHGFHASERSYRTQLQKWGFLKYNTETNPRVRNGAVTGRAVTRRRLNVQPPSQSADVSSANLSFSTHAIPSMPGFALNDINPQHWTFETEVPVESAGTSYANSQYDQTIQNASGVPVQYALGLDNVDASGQTALHRAVVREDINQIRSLLEKGAAVDIKDNGDNQPLHYAVMSKDPDLVRLLLRYGADTNVAGSLGRSPLHLAISLCDVEVAGLLLDEGASTTSQDHNGDSALHLAVSVESWSAASPAPLVDILTKAKADMNVPNARGLTPFHKLLSRNYDKKEYDYIPKFFESGASVNRPLPHGLSAFELFLAKSEYPWDCCGYFETLRRKRALTSFVEHGADPVTPLPSGESFISKCLEQSTWSWDNSESFALLELLCKNVRIGPIKENGNTTLHQLALACGRYWISKKARIHEAMEVLLNKGEDPNRQNLDGETPLLLLFANASKESSRPALQCLKTLLANGADPMIVDLKGNTSLFAAAKKQKGDEVNSILTAMREPKGPNDPVNSSGSTGPSRFIWKNWEEAIREDKWVDAKTHILAPSDDIPPDIAQKLCDTAFRVLSLIYDHGISQVCSD